MKKQINIKGINFIFEIKEDLRGKIYYLDISKDNRIKNIFGEIVISAKILLFQDFDNDYEKDSKIDKIIIDIMKDLISNEHNENSIYYQDNKIYLKFINGKEVEFTSSEWGYINAM